MTSTESANEALRATRAKELNNAETGGRNDIITIITANDASYDIKERVVLRRLSLKMRMEVGKRQQGRERGRLPPEDVAREVDLVLDTLGGPTTVRFLRTLKRGGALFPVFPGFSDAKEAANLGVTVSMTQVRSNGSQLAELARLLQTGQVRVAIDSTFRLADARKAHERAAGGHI